MSNAPSATPLQQLKLGRLLAHVEQDEKRIASTYQQALAGDYADSDNWNGTHFRKEVQEARDWLFRPQMDEIAGFKKFRKLLPEKDITWQTLAEGCFSTLLKKVRSHLERKGKTRDEANAMTIEEIVTKFPEALQAPQKGDPGRPSAYPKSKEYAVKERLRNPKKQLKDIYKECKTRCATMKTWKKEKLPQEFSSFKKVILEALRTARS